MADHKAVGTDGAVNFSHNLDAAFGHDIACDFQVRCKDRFAALAGGGGHGQFLSAPGVPANSVWLIEDEGRHPVKPILWAMVGFLPKRAIWGVVITDA
jgi:hypothetical protein